MSVDEKQWQVSRLDLLYDVLKDELVLSRESYKHNHEEEVEKITGRRNNILSCVVVGIAILTILSETQWLNKMTVLVLLFVDVICGLITFFIAHKYVRVTSRAYTHVENSLTYALGEFNHLYGFLLKETHSLTNITIQDLQLYKDFTKASMVIFMIPMYDGLTSHNSRFLGSLIKSEFQRNAEYIGKNIDTAITLFNSLDKTKLPAESLKQISETISEYRRISKQIESKRSSI